jgi:glycogen debranching enzyme
MVRQLWELGLATIKELETEEGILASSKEEIYGCVFGRDSLITSLKLLKAYEKTGDAYFLSVVRKILLNLAGLQGKEHNIESGEEPGKIIHEYRKERHEHLTKRSEKPWYLYPEGAMKNYDSVDATPLFLIAARRYYELSKDTKFLDELQPNINSALEWLIHNSHKHPLGFVSYHFLPERTHGGLLTQSWMDSRESVFHEDDSATPYPIAPVEVQAYAYAALKSWGKDNEAEKLKTNFNRYFVSTQPFFDIAFALDGDGKRMSAKRSSIGHLLWMKPTILEPVFVPKLVDLLFEDDIFESQAGIRTLSKKSSRYDAMSYHNGSLWPHDNAIIAEGLANHGFKKEAELLRQSLKNSWGYFESPIELFSYTEEGFREYIGTNGQKACKKQAWSAASILSELAGFL